MKPIVFTSLGALQWPSVCGFLTQEVDSRWRTG